MQVATGLFSNDDIAFVGPLYDLVDKSLSNCLSGIHELVSSVLITLVILHIGAIVFHGHVKKDNLFKPMVTGWKDGVSGESAKGGGVVALVLTLAFAAAVVYGASGA